MASNTPPTVLNNDVIRVPLIITTASSDGDSAVNTRRVSMSKLFRGLSFGSNTSSSQGSPGRSPSSRWTPSLANCYGGADDIQADASEKDRSQSLDRPLSVSQLPDYRSTSAVRGSPEISRDEEGRPNPNTSEQEGHSTVSAVSEPHASAGGRGTGGKVGPGKPRPPLPPVNATRSASGRAGGSQGTVGRTGRGGQGSGAGGGGQGSGGRGGRGQGSGAGGSGQGSGGRGGRGQGSGAGGSGQGSGGRGGRGQGSGAGGGGQGSGGGGGRRGNGGGDGGGEGGGDGGGDGNEEEEDELEKEKEAALGGPNLGMTPLLCAVGVGLNADNEGRRAMTKRELRSQILRNERMTRPVFDPNHPLINFGHRRWPIEDTTQYLKTVMPWLWPGGMGVKRQGISWQSDTSYRDRVTRLVQEFNSHGLPRNVHALLEHENPNPPNPEILFPSFRCPCWMQFLGENWYNETDGTILRRLGAGWTDGCQHFLIHLLTRLLTAMTQSYQHDSKDTFRVNNPDLGPKQHTGKWSDEITNLIDKMLETRGFEPFKGKNYNMREADRRIVAELCGIYKPQVSKRLQRMRHEARRNLGAGLAGGEEQPVPGHLQPARMSEEFTHDESLYLSKFLLRKKLFDPKFTPKDVPEQLTIDFKRDVAANPDHPRLPARIQVYGRHFLSNCKAYQYRLGYKLRTLSIAYYNLLGNKQGLGPYDPTEGTNNNMDLCEMVATHMERVLTQLHSETASGTRKISDYEARDIAAMIQASDAEVEAVAREMEDSLLEAEEVEDEQDESGDDPVPGGAAGAGPSGTATGAEIRHDRADPVDAPRPPIVRKRPRSRNPRQPRFGRAPTPEETAAAEAQSNDFAMRNFGPGSAQQRIQPILFDKLTGVDRLLTSSEIMRILELTPSPERIQSPPPPPPPPPKAAFSDIYQEIFEDHANSLKRRRFENPDDSSVPRVGFTPPHPPPTLQQAGTAPQPPDPPNSSPGQGATRPPPPHQPSPPHHQTQPKDHGQGRSPSQSAPPPPHQPDPRHHPQPPPVLGPDPGAGGPSFHPPHGGPPSPPPPPPTLDGGPDDPRWPRFNMFVADVAQYFPDIVQLIKPPTAFGIFYEHIAGLYPNTCQYIFPNQAPIGKFGGP